MGGEKIQGFGHAGQMDVIAGDKNTRVRPLANNPGKNQSIETTGSARNLDNGWRGQNILNLFHAVTPFC